ILVPTDFSANANKALDFAVQIAKEAIAEILLIHACDLLDTTLKDHLAIKREHNRRVVDEAKENLSLFTKSFQDKGEVTINTKLYDGIVTDTILRAVEENNADFIIIGTRGHRPLHERIFGSTTSGILGKANVPVTVISPLTEWHISSTNSLSADVKEQSDIKPTSTAVLDEAETQTEILPKTTPVEAGTFAPDAILFATNHFEENKELLNQIVDVAKLFSSTIHVVVFVDTDLAKAYDYVYNTKELHHYIEFLKNTYPDVSFKGELLEGEEFEATIEKYNDTNGIDIVAMVTYPKTFWDMLLKKKMTKEMAFHSKVPVLVVSGK
ncbi:MAG: universal stress protein, partial [Chitinophagaceae bacterium]|nr:universal stress protein [Chitinophagaceae bacterium]